MTSRTASDEDLWAVMAHSLLGSVATILGNTDMLRSHWDGLAPERRAEMLDAVAEQSRHVMAVLGDLVRLGDPELVAVLDDLASSGARTEG